MPEVWLLCAFAIVPVALFAVFTIYYYVGKGKKVKITVLHKRKNIFDDFNQVTYSNGTSTHYTIDCTFDNSSKIHTLGCECSIYERLKTNKSYIVTIKMMEIKKIHKK